MPVIRGMPLSVETGKVLRRAGFKYARATPDIESLALELIAGVDRAHLLEPAAAYEIYSVAEVGQQLFPEAGTIASLLAGAKELAVVVGTIGPGLEEGVVDCFRRGEPLRGVLLDGIGSAAIDSLTEEVYRFLASEVSSRGYEVGSPINPGMPGLPITRQWQLFEMAPAWEIGVSLTPSGIMVPRKSTSMVLGIGPQMTKWTKAEVCASCSLSQTCSYKVSQI
jgi:hypothetical protein